MLSNNKTTLLIIFLSILTIILIVAIALVSTFSQQRNIAVVNKTNSTQENIKNVKNLTTNNQNTPIKKPVQVSTTILPSVVPTKKQVIQSLTIPNQNPATLDPSRVNMVKQILSCLNDMRDKRGVYLYERTCDDVSHCTDLSVNNSGPRPIWARYLSYKTINDQNDLSILNNDLIINTTKIPTLQNDFWNCKLMQEIVDDSTLEVTIKNMAKQICVQSVYSPGLVDEANAFIQTQQPLEPDFQKDSPIISSTYNDLVNKYAFYASDFLAKGQINNAPTTIKQAQYFFLQTYLHYQKQRTSVSLDQVCLIGETVLDFYRINNNPKYLEFADKLWTDNNLQNAFDSKDSSSLVDKSICGLFANKMKKITGNMKYQIFVDKLIDSLGNQLNKETGCYYSKSINNLMEQQSKENSLIIALLLSQ